MARTQTLKKEPLRKYKTNTSITVYDFLKIDGHTETPLVMRLVAKEAIDHVNVVCP